MSRLYFHAENATAEVWGGEWSWLDSLAKKTALGHLDLQHNGDRLRPLIRSGHELRDGYRTGLGCAITWASWFATSWRVNGDKFIEWRGRPLSCGRISLNTAAAVGSEAFRFAIRIAGQGDIHAWVDGPDRAWAASLIEEGLEVGFLRRRVQTWDVGWVQVAELLRASDDGPVVMSYSVEDSFPNPKAAGFAPQMPDGWRPGGWAESDWLDDVDDEMRGDYWDEHVSELFGGFDKAGRWRRGIEGLRARPAANLQIQPNGGRFHFGPDLTVFDLLADDRDERIGAAFADYDAALKDGRAEE